MIATPLGWLGNRYSIERATLRAASLSSLIAAILIIVGGGVVRVTGSGLGCPDWPACTGDSLGPTVEMGIHGVIEFVNRLLTGVLCVIVAWVIIAARLQRQPAPDVTRWAWAQFWIVLLNAIVGGITVWIKLNPYVVAAHFLAATLLLTAAAVTWDKSQHLDHPSRSKASAQTRRLSNALLAVTAVLVIVGTAVTGSGPHAGDSSEVPRMSFSWEAVTVLHSAAAVCVTVLAVVLWRVTYLREEDAVRQRTMLFIVVLMSQGAVGVFQVITQLPEILVVLHLVGSALVWVGVIRIGLASRSNSTLSGSSNRSSVTTMS